MMRFPKIGLGVLLSILLVWYGAGAYYRFTAGECERETEGAYIGEHCYLALRDSSLFRLYDAKSGEKLAERNFTEIDIPRIIWSDDRVIYDLGASPSGYISLPPTWLDRVRAKLP
ncbi:hypothetical protein [Cupriavidus sp. BIS7]|jgi:hypothetical protein|uniref:hypothetical protein n=1 Tax=Cupriavidus sp. BIS7 TaxID=1217718 RepID=UPI000363C32B|nr:hypothetical protein [Cupriavidus sp. BIS7]